MEARPTKLAIIGAGAVGTAVAYASLIRGVARTIALMDINTAKVTADSIEYSASEGSSGTDSFSYVVEDRLGVTMTEIIKTEETGA